jgi:hypothetical protein
MQEREMGKRNASFISILLLQLLDEFDSNPSSN